MSEVEGEFTDAIMIKNDNNNPNLADELADAIKDLDSTLSQSEKQSQGENTKAKREVKKDIQEFKEEIKAGVSTISGFWSEFKDYIENAEIIDDSLSYVAGQAFTGLMNSFVSDLIVPFFAAVIGRPNVSNFFLVLKQGKDAKARYKTIKQATEGGATIVPFGRFIQKAINFIFLGFSLMIFVRMFRSLLFSRRQAIKDKEKAKSKAQERDCPFCYSKISAKATRCPHCTSQVPV